MATRVFFYTLRPYDELGIAQRLAPQLDVEFGSTQEYPTLENTELAKGYDAVSVTPCDMSAPMVKRFHELGVKSICCRSIGYDHVDRETARELGMEATSFANPNGLDAEDHYSTARDMAKLACAAGRTLVSCAERSGQRLVAVTLQDGNDWADHEALYDYGFSTYPAHRAAVLGKTLYHAPVKNGLRASVPLVAAESFSWPLAEGETLDMTVELDTPLTAPHAAGRRAGEAVFSLNGREVGRIGLLCGEAVPPKLDSAMAVLKHGLLISDED